MGDNGWEEAGRASNRGIRPAAATSPTNLARKDLREQCGFTGGSGRRDRGQKDKKRNGFREVNQIFPGGRRFRESLADTAHQLAALITKVMTKSAQWPRSFPAGAFRLPLPNRRLRGTVFQRGVTEVPTTIPRSEGACSRSLLAGDSGNMVSRHGSESPASRLLQSARNSCHTTPEAVRKLHCAEECRALLRQRRAENLNNTRPFAAPPKWRRHLA